MKDQLKDAMKQAMREKRKLEVETIRSLLSAIQYEEMAKKTEELSTEATMAVLKGELKKQKESLEFAEKDARVELIEEAKTRMSCIERFLPQQLSAEDLEKIITQVAKDSAEANVGLIMKQLKESYAGQYDGKLASEIARKVLS